MHSKYNRGRGGSLKVKIKNILDPFNRYPKEEPFKKYLYNKEKAKKDSSTPYKTIEPTRKPFAMRWTKFEFLVLAQILKIIRSAKRKRSDIKIDDYLIETVRRRNFIAF